MTPPIAFHSWVFIQQKEIYRSTSPVYEFGHRKRRFILTINMARGQPMRRTAMAVIAASGLALTVATAEETPTRQYAPADSTFSIIAVEKDTGLLGLGVQSKALSIGNRVVTGKGGVAIVGHAPAPN